jgi:hypothetical protein
MCCYSCALAQEYAQLDDFVKSGVNTMADKKSSVIYPPIDPSDVKRIEK